MGLEELTKRYDNALADLDTSGIAPKILLPLNLAKSRYTGACETYQKEATNKGPVKKDLKAAENAVESAVKAVETHAAKIRAEKKPVSVSATEVPTEPGGSSPFVPVQTSWIEAVIEEEIEEVIEMPIIRPKGTASTSTQGGNGGASGATKSTPMTGVGKVAERKAPEMSAPLEQTAIKETNPRVEQLFNGAVEQLRLLKAAKWVNVSKIPLYVESMKKARADQDIEGLEKFVRAFGGELQRLKEETSSSDGESKEQEAEGTELKAGEKEAEEKRVAAEKLRQEKEAEEKRVAAEKLRQEKEAEEKRVAAEKLRQEKEAEEKRVAAEKLRQEKEAEEKRVAAEKLRQEKEAEEKRVAAEKLRQETEAEEKRVAAEKLRQETEAEEKRVAAEKLRQEKEAEEKRVAAEKLRQETEAEEKRVAAEKLRQEKEAEEKRVAAEKLRQEKEAEEKRVAAEKLRQETEAEEKRVAAEKLRQEKEAEEKRVAAEKLRQEKEAEEKRVAAEKLRQEKEAEEKRVAAEKLRQEKEAEEKRVAAEKLRQEKEAEEKRVAAEKLRQEKEAEEKRVAAEKLRQEKEAEEKESFEGEVVPNQSTENAEATKAYNALAKKLDKKLKPAEVKALKALAATNPKIAASVAGVLDDLAGSSGELPPPITAVKAEEVSANSDKKVEEAIDKQFAHITDAVLDLWQKLSAKGLNKPEFPADVFNKTRQAAVDKYNTPAPGSHAAAVKDLQEFWDAMKKKSAEAAKEAEGMDAFKNLTTEKENEAAAETDKANAGKSLAATALREAVQSGLLARTTSPEDDLQTAATRAKATDDVIKKFKDHPATALDALELVGRTKHPEVIAKGVDVAGKLRANRFASSKDGGWGASAGKMTRNALAMGGMLGGKYFEEMESYYAGDHHSKEDPLIPMVEGTDGRKVIKPDKGQKEKGTAYTKAIANDLVSDNGTVNFSSGKLKGTLNNLKFHPRSLQTPLFALTANLQDVQEKFTQPPLSKNPYVQKLGTVKKPKNGGHGEKAKGLVRDCLGLGSGHDPTDADAKRAVMTALITPFAQGNVGSCFATGPCLKFKEADPLGYMADLGQIVENGTLRKGTKAGDPPPLPVITNLPPPTKENPLMRSWEYTVTTMGARTKKSHEKKQLSQAIFGNGTNGLAALGGEHKAKIKTAVSKAFNFSYDPIAKLEGVAADGSSSKGKWALKTNSIRGEVDVTDEESFLAHLKTSIEKEITPDAELQKKLNEFFTGSKKKAFVTQMRAGYDEGRGAPWAKSGGGFGHGATEVLFGKDANGKPPKEEKFFDPTTGGPDKAGALLTSIVKSVPNTAPKHVTVSVAGIHGMNLLPTHPSLARLQPKDGKTAEDKVREELIEPGAKIAARQPKERMVALHNKAIESVLSSLYGKDEAGLSEVIPPTGDMTPGELKASLTSQVESKITSNVDKEMEKKPDVVTKAVQKKFLAVKAQHKTACDKIRKETNATILQNYKDAHAKVNTDYDVAWEQYLEEVEAYNKVGGAGLTEPVAPERGEYPPEPTYPEDSELTFPPEPQFTEHEGALKTEYKSEQIKAKKAAVANGIDNLLMKELAPPEFVIADTNWGGQTGHTVHVIAPDPCTGAPILWKKDEPSGDYSRETDDWLTKDWAVMKKGAEYT